MKENKKKITRSIIRSLICFLIVLLTVIGPMTTQAIPGLLITTASASDYVYTYYPKYTGKSGSLVDALKAVGVDSSFKNRKSIAALNGYTAYVGSASQNTSLLNKLKNGTLIKSRTSVSSDWSIDMPASVTIEQGKTASVDIKFCGDGISGFNGDLSNSNVSAGFSNTSWKPAGQWCSVRLNLAAKSVGTTTFTFKLSGSKTASRSITINVVNTSASLVNTNLSRVNYISQGSQTCKASSVAMALNLLIGQNSYTTASMGNSNCRGIDGNRYTASNGAIYAATYKTDSYVGSASEQRAEIDKAVNAGVSIVVAVHSTRSGYTRHHWIVVVGKSGGDYLVVDPASGRAGAMSANVKTMSSLSYDFGLTDYGMPHYGYVTFTKK